MSYVEKCEHCKEHFACFHMQGKPCDMEQAIADQAARFHDEIVRRQGIVRDNQELDLKHLNHLRAELATERETSRLLRVAMDARDEGYTQSRRRMSALERELTTERARLDWLEDKRPILWALEDHATGRYWLLTDFPGYTEEAASQHETARAAIDAAMKKETK